MTLTRTALQPEISDANPKESRDRTLEQLLAANELGRGAGWLTQGAVLGMTALAVAALAICANDLLGWATHRILLLLTLGGIGCWRWSWFLLQNGRAILYRYVAYPRLRRQAERAVAAAGPVPEIVVMATTYCEKEWITKLVFAAIIGELSTLEGLVRRPRVVVATGCEEDEVTISSLFAGLSRSSSNPPAEFWPPELVLVREAGGKRAAIAAALREIVKGGPRPDAAVLFIDGDTILRPEFFRTVLPLFRLDPAVAAVTTNEEGYVKGPSWFGEWISLRFGLRHRTMCSVALSEKLLCLTGRLSVFRGSVVLEPSFLDQIEHDVIRHWLWGPYEMLSGDDKSTWFWLSRNGCRMLYVPDAKVTTIEVVQGIGLRRAWANIRRWSGNSLRHNWRAMCLGPQKLGWFPWWSLLDQRFAMFTVLFGPVICLMALCNGRFGMAASFALWLLLSRLAHATIAWRHGLRWSAFYVPLLLLSDWATAISKIWVLFHPAKQSWLNRGGRTLDSTRQSSGYAVQTALAHYLYGFTCAAVLICICLAAGFLPLQREARLFLDGGEKDLAQNTSPTPHRELHSDGFGVRPGPELRQKPRGLQSGSIHVSARIQPEFLQIQSHQDHIFYENQTRQSIPH